MIAPEEILKKYYGYSYFRPLQREIIESVLQRNHTLGILPTGGGKSVCFQVPGLILDGVSIVITPLIALMKDQVEQLKSRGIRAAAIYSGMHPREIDNTLDNFVLGDYKFLYVSPERLETEIMIERAKRMKIGLLVVDEAHCISKWGHDFRPPYLRIANFQNYLNKNTPIIALTATATERVRKDIINNLGMNKCQVFVKSFARNNLSLFSIQTEQKSTTLLNLLKEHAGSSIVYCQTRKQTKETSDFLIKNGIQADFYHAGLENKIRFEKQEKWIKSNNNVIVSTNAFGMGIDKPDVRSVFHLDLPENLEAYYQEAGRAGRDEKESVAYVIYQQKDISDSTNLIELRYPHPERIKRIYQCLCNKYKLAVGSKALESYDFDMFDFCSTFGINSLEAHYGLKILAEQGVLLLSDSYFSPSKIMITMTGRDIYEFQLKNEILGDFLKTILRIYGGELYSNFLTIHENEIASAAKISFSETISKLEFLQKLEIIEYQKQSNSAKITFLHSRFDAEHLPVNFKEINDKKLREINEKGKVVEFATNSRKCKMQQLQEHFDEFNTKRCGHCDNCLRIDKIKMNSQRILEITSQINKIMPVSVQKLESQFDATEYDILEKILEEQFSKNNWSMDRQGLIFKIN